MIFNILQLDPIRGGEKDGAAGVLKGAATGIGK